MAARHLTHSRMYLGLERVERAHNPHGRQPTADRSDPSPHRSYSLNEITDAIDDLTLMLVEARTYRATALIIFFDDICENKSTRDHWRVRCRELRAQIRAWRTLLDVQIVEAEQQLRAARRVRKAAGAFVVG